MAPILVVAGRWRTKRDVAISSHLSARRVLLLHSPPRSSRKRRPSALFFVGSSGSEHFWQLLQQDMCELRYTEGRNVRYEFRSDAGQKNRLPSSAEELVQLKVDLDLIRFERARP